MATESKNKIPAPKLFEAVLSYYAGVYVTVLNIIQCIAFGFLVIGVKDMISERDMTPVTVIATAFRVVATFTMILFVWHRYTTELQYLWPMSFWDTIIPFLIGGAECWVVFSVNAKAIFLSQFIGAIMMVQIFAVAAYLYTRLKRQKQFAQKLYEDFYNNTQFVSHLIAFLKKYDTDHAIRMAVAFVGSSTFLFAAIWWTDSIVMEIAFATVCIATLLFRGFHYSFDKELKRDVNLHSYFS